MTLQQIRFFIALAEHLNYREVSERFYMTQPTLSRQITALEEELRVRLFNRSTKGTTLTPAGEIFYKEMRSRYQDLNDLLGVIREIDAQQSSHLTIAVEMEQLISPVLLKAIEDFRAIEPEVKIILTRAPISDLHVGLLDGRFDIVNMLALQNELNTRLEKIQLSEEQSCIMMRRDLGESYPDGITPAEAEDLIRRIPLTLFAKENFPNELDPLQELYRVTGIQPSVDRVDFCQAAPFSIALMVESGLCMTLANTTHAIEYIPIPKIRYDKALSLSKEVIARRSPIMIFGQIRRPLKIHLNLGCCVVSGKNRFSDRSWLDATADAVHFRCAIVHFLEDVLIGSHPDAVGSSVTQEFV